MKENCVRPCEMTNFLLTPYLLLEKTLSLQEAGRSVGRVVPPSLAIHNF
jgi:hypothetical protein